MSLIAIASRAVGLSESQGKAALQDYLTTGGVNIDPATRAWCADFVNATLSQGGLEGTGSGMARSFMDWGQAVDTPQRGDIAVFSRGDPNGPSGHVGFFDSFNPDGSINVLGGNQDDSVNISPYSADRLLGFRRPGQAAAPQNGPQNALTGQVGQGTGQNALVAPMERPSVKNALIDPQMFMARQVQYSNPFEAAYANG